jgi:hypothetical protein
MLKKAALSIILFVAILALAGCAAPHSVQSRTKKITTKMDPRIRFSTESRFNFAGDIAYNILSIDQKNDHALLKRNVSQRGYKIFQFNERPEYIIWMNFSEHFKQNDLEQFGLQRPPSPAILTISVYEFKGFPKNKNLIWHGWCTDHPERMNSNLDFYISSLLDHFGENYSSDR